MPHAAEASRPSLHDAEELDPDPYFDCAGRPFHRTVEGAQGTTYTVKEGRWPKKYIDDDEQRLFIALRKAEGEGEDQRALVVCFTAADAGTETATVEMRIEDSLRRPEDAKLIAGVALEHCGLSGLEDVRVEPGAIIGPPRQALDVARLLGGGEQAPDQDHGAEDKQQLRYAA